MTVRRTAEQLWALYNSSPNCPAWEHVIRYGESYHDDRAWTVRWGGTGNRPKTFASLAAHPRLLEPGPKGPSSAAGAFQITMTTWDSLAYLNLPDFSAKSQRIAMMALTERHGALEDVLAGRLDEAMRKCRTEWSSLPFGTDGQPTIALADAHQVFTNYGGRPASDTQPAAPIEERDVGTEKAATSFDWGTLASVGGGIATAAATVFGSPLAGAVVGSLVAAFKPVLQDKITKEIGRHADAATATLVGTELTKVITDTTLAVTGIADPVAAIAEVRNSPSKLAKVEDAVEQKLADMLPLLNELHRQAQERFAVEAADRNDAAGRVSRVGWNIQRYLVMGGMGVTAVIVLFLLVSLVVQIALAEEHLPDATLIAFAGPILVMAMRGWSEMFAFAFGGTQEGSPASPSRKDTK